MTARLRRVSVQDFQSLSDVDLELGQLTVIVGRTNAGKSALVRAMQAALFNWSGGDFVREGSSKATVTLDFEAANGDFGQLRWQKPRKGGAEYTIFPDARIAHSAPITVTRAGRETVPEIDALTGVREIETEGVRARLQFASQFDEPFLLSSSGGQAAKLLAHVSKLDVLVKAQIHARQDLTRTRRRAEEATAQAEAFAQQLEAMPDFEALLKKAEALVEVLATLKRLHQRTQLVSVLSREAAQLSSLHQRWLEKQLPERFQALNQQAIGLSVVAGMLREWRLERVGLDGVKIAVEDRSAQLKQVEADLSSALDELKVCPVCGRAM